jgi:hypothetical protein
MMDELGTLRTVVNKLSRKGGKKRVKSRKRVSKGFKFKTFRKIT